MKSDAKVITLKKTNENATFIPVCLADNNLFLVDASDPTGTMTVLRIMEQDDLEYWRSEEGVREYYDDIWRMAVAAGRTTDGLDDFIAEEGDTDFDNDSEYFPNKDTYGTDVFDDYEELREIVDAAVEKDSGCKVGTWECAGCYPPESEKIQIVFDPLLLKAK